MEYVDDQTLKKLTRFRHKLHRIAELSGEERKTAREVKAFLKDLKPDSLIEGVGGNGLVATWYGNRKQDGTSVMIRCELDALPIPEENEIAYRSETEGVSHKCGHDGHMAIVAGVGQVLSKFDLWEGSVHLLFQPSEETGQGAERILADETFQSLAPDYIFALHNLPGYPENKVLIKDDIFASASRGLVVNLKGSTSHAAHPEKGKSPALALAQLIQLLSAFPQFYTSIDEAAKVTVIHSKLGEIAFGTSPGRAELRATIRTFNNSVMQRLCDKTEQVITDIAGAHRLDAKTEWTEIFETTENDRECNEIIRKAADINGFDSEEKKSPFAWSEDFGRFTSRFKGAIFGLGAGMDRPQLHASDYDFPDELLPAGIRMFSEIINQLVGFDH